MKKLAFTMAEVLICITIIGIIAAITIPIVNDARPDKDKVLFKKSMMTLQSALALAMDSQQLKAENSYFMDPDLDASFFCTELANIINTSGKINCTDSSTYDAPNFVSTDGNKFWGLEGAFTQPTKTIYTDRMLTTKEKSRLYESRDSYHTTPGLKLLIHHYGKVEIPSTDEYAYENSLL